MPSDVVREFADSTRGLVVAPAGCGKTYLIAQAVQHNDGRQLILTHTHAGVRALLNYLRGRGVPTERYRVGTIDGFALRYANAFSKISGWGNTQPTDDAWNELRPAAVTAMKHRAVQRVITNSYTGVYVDEYQDCNSGQHGVIEMLSEIIPTRILGDPLQAVFRKINKDHHCEWTTVESFFDKVGELDTPYRWVNRNEELGKWLLDIRQKLIAGEPIDISYTPVVIDSEIKHQHQLAACRRLIRSDGQSTLALRQWGRQCHSMARSLNGSFHSMETVECEDLLKWTTRIENAKGCDRVVEVIEFAKECISRLPDAIKRLGQRFSDGKIPNPTRLDFIRVVNAMKAVMENDDVRPVETAFATIERINEHLVLARRELWKEMRRSVRQHAELPKDSLCETAWYVRNKARHIGRHVDRRCLSTVLLVKGLEFDHAVILNAEEHQDAEDLYVAMTRASRSLTILSESSTLTRPKPHFVTQQSHK